MARTTFHLEVAAAGEVVPKRGARPTRCQREVVPTRRSVSTVDKVRWGHLNDFSVFESPFVFEPPTSILQRCMHVLTCLEGENQGRRIRVSHFRPRAMWTSVRDASWYICEPAFTKPLVKARHPFISTPTRHLLGEIASNDVTNAPLHKAHTLWRRSFKAPSHSWCSFGNLTACIK